MNTKKLKRLKNKLHKELVLIKEGNPILLENDLIKIYITIIDELIKTQEELKKPIYM